jgi:hypothetical protein
LDRPNSFSSSSPETKSLSSVIPLVKMATEFFKGSKINVKEGDIITFPSYLYHRSPINKINKRKTVIVFNSSFEQLNLAY